jgi:hypothetical protein
MLFQGSPPTQADVSALQHMAYAITPQVSVLTPWTCCVHNVSFPIQHGSPSLQPHARCQIDTLHIIHILDTLRDVIQADEVIDNDALHDELLDAEGDIDQLVAHAPCDALLLLALDGHSQLLEIGVGFVGFHLSDMSDNNTLSHTLYTPTHLEHELCAV